MWSAFFITNWKRTVCIQDMEEVSLEISLHDHWVFLLDLIYLIYSLSSQIILLFYFYFLCLAYIACLDSILLNHTGGCYDLYWTK